MAIEVYAFVLVSILENNHLHFHVKCPIDKSTCCVLVLVVNLVVVVSVYSSCAEAVFQGWRSLRFRPPLIERGSLSTLFKIGCPLWWGSKLWIIFWYVQLTVHIKFVPH